MACTYVNPEHLPDGCKASKSEHDFEGNMSRDYTHHVWCAKPFDWSELDGEEGATG